jgi:hypothetical protein
VIHRIIAPVGRFLLVAVFTLQIIVYAETWYWAVLTMVIGVLTLERLRKEEAAVLDVLTGAPGQYQDADQGQRDE